MTIANGKKMLVINEDKKIYSASCSETAKSDDQVVKHFDYGFPYLNRIINEDCINFMHRLKNLYPTGIYNLTFADPPYNLEKTYTKYNDYKQESEYINWCNKWLEGMYNVLKPGGSLLVLNIPKWAVYHFITLSPKMHFRNWIVWDALSTPSGKLLPAHYSLLHFTKPLKNNFIIRQSHNLSIDSRKYCRRKKCIRTRKNTNDSKEVLGDIWSDIHRIKHKKNRDSHPCQLPIKLMDRIIRLYSNEGDLIFDPFGGAGTTAIAAKLNNRFFTTTDIDEQYNEIAMDNLGRIQQVNSRHYLFTKKSIERPKKACKMSQKNVEIRYLNICKKNNNIIDVSSLQDIDLKLYESIVNDYPKGFNFLRKIANRYLENENIINKRDI